MYLKRLEILGFKSFADRTVLNFEPGITVVVGPNGCGKSNIFDSIRWVLGEQSIKSLRGSKMEDVIFNGTASKPALGFAEVSLTFSNENKILPIEYEEVTVSRRLFRSGESEYLINKLPVRLRDVCELFMGTGIGSESYSLVEQGKIDLMISSRPEDRRTIFDEAAGITKYKSKKKEALNKLKDTENNLLRISDIIAELKRQIASIERQANKARRYKDEFEKLKNLEIQYALFQIKELKEKKDSKSTKLNELNENSSASDKSIQKIIDQISEKNIKTNELRNKLSEISQDCLRKDNLIERNAHNIKINNERIHDADSRRNKIDEQKIQLKQRVAQQKEKIQALEIEFSTMTTSKNSKHNELSNKNELIKEISGSIKGCENEISHLKLDIMELTTEKTSVKNSVTEASARFHSLLSRKKRLDLEKSKVDTEKTTVDEEFQKVNSEWHMIQDDLTELSDRRSAIFSECGALNGEASTLQEKIADLEKKKLSMESQKEFIESLQLKYDDIPGGDLSVLITNPGKSDDQAAVLGKIKHVSDLDARYKPLLEQHFNVQDLDGLKQVMCETKFISLDLQKIINRIDEITSNISQSRVQADSVKERIESKEAEIALFDTDIRKKELQLSNKQTQKDSINETLSKLKEELELLVLESEETKEDVEKIRQKELELKNQQEQMETKIADFENKIIENQSAISKSINLREETNISIAQLQAELESLEERHKAEQDKYKMLQDAWKQDLDTLSSFEKETFDLLEKEEQLHKDNAIFEEQVKQARQEKSNLEGSVSEFNEKISELNKVIDEHRSNLDMRQKEHESIKTQIHEIMMQNQKIEFDEKSINDRLEQTYKVLIREIQTQITLEENRDYQILPNEIETLKKRVDRFGSVNLVAIEEFDELKERYEFLTKQQEDLLTSKESLNDTIAKINRTSRKLFLETFQKVSEEFRKYFRMLFGGGDAQLILMDPHQPLESGIEIIARPPGKKLQSISLLSGGEKALSAIALIFGVFKIKPSPFCVLDEIDAPLDESNVGRYSGLLKEFTKDSQFIVISHNKKTMVNADVMYGITMQETGISKIVSVKFGDAEVSTEEAVAAV